MADVIHAPGGEAASTAGAMPSRDAELPIELRFEELARRWERETAFCSSASEIVGHPAYQEIIALGRGVVPLILAELRRRPNH